MIFCGHFPDGAEKFTTTDMVGRAGQWYLRQMLGSANIDAGPILALLTGNLSYQIEHHLYPNLPSRRLAEISVRVRQLCDKYDLPYTSGPLPVQYAKSWRTIAKLSLPDRFLRASADDARRPAASGCSTFWTPARADSRPPSPRSAAGVSRQYRRPPASAGCRRTRRGWGRSVRPRPDPARQRLDLLVVDLKVEDLEVLPHALRLNGFGKTMSPRSMCQRSTTWAGCAPVARAMRATTGSPGAPCPGRSATTPR